MNICTLNRKVVDWLDFPAIFMFECGRHLGDTLRPPHTRFQKSHHDEDTADNLGP